MRGAPLGVFLDQWCHPEEARVTRQDDLWHHERVAPAALWHIEWKASVGKFVHNRLSVLKQLSRQIRHVNSVAVDRREGSLVVVMRVSRKRSKKIQKGKGTRSETRQMARKEVERECTEVRRKLSRDARSCDWYPMFYPNLLIHDDNVITRTYRGTETRGRFDLCST